jgi:hypothetical protein
MVKMRRHAARRLARQIGLSASALLLLGVARVPCAELPTEYEVKAAYLYNFAKFVEWPPEALAGGAEPFVIAVVGNDPFGRTLDDLLATKTVQDRPLAIKRVATPEEAVRAHVAFVSASEQARLPRILQVLKNTSVLTVGDMPEFAERGGMIGFRMDGQKVRFDINPEPAEDARLRMSSQLLKLARIVGAGQR